MGRDRWSLGRNKATRAPKQRIIVYCEGRNTEPTYFRALQRRFKNALIELEITHAGVPLTVAKRAVERAVTEGLAKGAKKPKNSFEANDQVWAAFDRDEHPNFNEAIALCEAKGVKVCRSNPCFEVWLILHEEDFHRPDDHDGVCAHLRLLRPEYDPAGAKICDFDHMLARVEIAEARAKTQLTRREEEGLPYGRPSTTAGELTAAIRRAADIHKAR